VAHRGGNTFFVYGLYDSGDRDVCRYVGAASKLSRPLAHEREARTRCNTYRYKWIRKVVAEGRRIEWRVLESCSDWPTTLEAEVRIIQEMRAAGARLTNVTDGGQGGFNPSPEVRAKRAAGIRAALATPESKAKRSASARAAWARPGERERRVGIERLALSRPEVRARKSASAKKWTSEPEARARLSEQQRAAWARPEGAKRREAAKAVMARPEVRAKMLAFVTSDDERRRRSEAAQSRWKQPEFRAAHAAAWAAKRLKNPKPIVAKPVPKPKKTAEEWKAYYKAYYLAHRERCLAYARRRRSADVAVTNGA